VKGEGGKREQSARNATLSAYGAPPDPQLYSRGLLLSGSGGERKGEGKQKVREGKGKRVEGILL